MITDKDIQKIVSALIPIFATKEDLYNLEKKLDEKLINVRNDIIINLDTLLGEVKAMREEQLSFLRRQESNLQLDRMTQQNNHHQ